MSLRKDFIELVTNRMLDLWESAERWTQGVVARNEDKQDVQAESPWAVQWCAIGVAQRALHDLSLFESDYSAEFFTFLDHYTWYVTDGAYRQVARYNDDDHTSFEDMRLFVKGLRDTDPDEVEHHAAEASECNCDSCRAIRQMQAQLPAESESSDSPF
jgi:hypothetical protein